MAISFQFFEQGEVVKAITILQMDKLTISAIDQCVDWVYLGTDRKVNINPINPDQPKLLQTAANIRNYDDGAVITQWLNGCPKGQPVADLLPD